VLAKFFLLLSFWIIVKKNSLSSVVKQSIHFI
jgi:hypothetical protein